MDVHDKSEKSDMNCCPLCSFLTEHINIFDIYKLEGIDKVMLNNILN